MINRVNVYYYAVSRQQVKPLLRYSNLTVIKMAYIQTYMQTNLYRRNRGNESEALKVRMANFRL